MSSAETHILVGGVLFRSSSSSSSLPHTADAKSLRELQSIPIEGGTDMVRLKARLLSASTTSSSSVVKKIEFLKID